MDIQDFKKRSAEYGIAPDFSLIEKNLRSGQADVQIKIYELLKGTILNSGELVEIYCYLTQMKSLSEDLLKQLIGYVITAFEIFDQDISTEEESKAVIFCTAVIPELFRLLSAHEKPDFLEKVKRLSEKPELDTLLKEPLRKMVKEL